MHPATAPLSMSVVGPGRLGTALARAFRSAGLEVQGPLRRGDIASEADVVLLCVPDAEIAAAARAHAATGRFIGHTSGATPLAESGVDFGLHPLGSFLGTEDLAAFRGLGVAIAGRTPAALDAARQLADALGATVFAIDDEARAAYHAAASVASNYLVTLQAAAEQLAQTAGLEPAESRALFAPLVRATVENWAAHGPASALTGPIARGDEATIDRQRTAVAASAPDLLPLFDVLAERTRVLAAKKETAQ
jgi:predicted short-subunit dehydrogenase-like oxidoreductase (DUF2520 family)